MGSIEVGKFVELLGKGNPKLVEPLFASHLTWSAPEWEGAVAVRKTAINFNTVKQYLLYSQQKLKAAKEALQAKQAPWKDLYHALRLAKEANRLASGNDVRSILFLNMLLFYLKTNFSRSFIGKARTAKK
jgi:RNA repair pathway DNA polymerase beta family